MSGNDTILPWELGPRRSRRLKIGQTQTANACTLLPTPKLASFLYTIFPKRPVLKREKSRTQTPLFLWTKPPAMLLHGSARDWTGLNPAAGQLRAPLGRKDAHDPQLWLLTAFPW